MSLKDYKSLETFKINNNVEMISLDLSGCTSLNDLGQLNYSYSYYYDIWSDISTTSFPRLAYLNLSGCSSLPELYIRSVKELNMSGCTALKKLHIRNYETRYYEQAPESYKDVCMYPVENLNIEGCSALEDLLIYRSALKSLELNGFENLSRIEVSANSELVSVNAANCISMDRIDCGNNKKLTDLNINGCSNLRILYCNNNKLSKLDISSCSNLKTLYCFDNEIAYLDLDKNFSLEDNYDNGYYFRIDQKIHNLKAKRVGKFWQIDFKDYMPLEKVKYINTTDIRFYDGANNSYWSNAAYFSFDPSTGIMLLKSDFPPAMVEYHYHTRSNPSNKDMNVRLVHNQIYPYVFIHSNFYSQTFNGHIYIHDISNNGYLHYTNTLINGIKQDLINEQYINDNIRTFSGINSYYYDMSGLTADGNSRIILTVQPEEPGIVTFSIPSNLGLTLENLSRDKYGTASISIPTVKLTDNSYQASAVLIAPESYPASYKNFPSDKFNLTVTFMNNNGDIISTDRDLILHAAPVMLIHGLRGNIEGTFNVKGDSGIFYELTKAGYISNDVDIGGWDYDGTQGPNDILADDYNGLYYAIGNKLLNYRNRGLECTRVDIVAHSMGGLMARKFLQEPDNDSDDGNNRSILAYKQGMVRRVITVATPHRGSPWAPILRLKDNWLHSGLDLVLHFINALLNIAGQTYLTNDAESAYRDLEPGAQNYGYPENVPMHSICSDVSNGDIISALGHEINASDLAGLKQMFNYSGHDLIVPVRSAVGDFKSQYTKIFKSNDVWAYSHMGICAQKEVGEKVVELLRGPVTNFQIGDYGSNDDNLELPAITKEDLPNATKGVEYYHALNITNVNYISFSSLPKGLKFDGSEGLYAITGKPEKIGTTKFTITAHNDNGRVSEEFTITVYEGVSISTTSLKNGAVDKKYSAKIKSKGSKPITFTAQNLPDGLSINSNTGEISGTPSVYGSFPLIITAKNPSSEANININLVIKPVAPKISGKLNAGSLNEPYSSTFTLSKGSQPVTWTLEGNLPDGLSFDAEYATIHGTPTQACKNSIKIIAANDSGTDKKSLTLTIKGIKPKFSGKFNTFTLGKYDSSSLTLSQGSKPVTLSYSGNLPAGLEFDSESLILSGTPTEIWNKSINITASNGAGKLTKSFRIQVKGTAPKISVKSLPSGTVGEDYNFTLSASGSQPITFTAENLPSGLYVDGDKITGTPTQTCKKQSVTIIAANPVKTVRKKLKISISANSAKIDTQANDSELEDVAVNQAPWNDTPDSEPAKIIFGQERNLSSLNTNNINISGDYEIAAVLPEIHVTESGLYEIDIELHTNIKTGAKLIWLACPKNIMPSEDDFIAEFYDETGAEINQVPANHKITVSAWLNKGVIYEPVIAVNN